MASCSKAEATRLKELQDVLGEFQDACVAGGLLRRYAEGLPTRTGNRGQLNALGQLIAGQDRRAAIRRAGFANAWERFDSSGGPTRDSSPAWRRVGPRSTPKAT